MEKHTLEHNIFLNKILASYTQALIRKIALSNDFSQIALSNHFGVVYSSAVKLNPAEDPNRAWVVRGKQTADARKHKNVSNTINGSLSMILGFINVAMFTNCFPC